MYHIQELMREQTYKEPNGNVKILPPVIKPKFSTAKKCSVPACESCLLVWAKKQSPVIAKQNPVAEKEGALARGRTKVGDCVSTDQLIYNTPG